MDSRVWTRGNMLDSCGSMGSCSCAGLIGCGDGFWRDDSGAWRPAAGRSRTLLQLLADVSLMFSLASFRRKHVVLEEIQFLALPSYSSIACLAFFKCDSGSHVASHSG